MAKKCARTFSIVVEKGKKSILDVSHLLPDALPRSVRASSTRPSASHLLAVHGVCCRLAMRHRNYATTSAHMRQRSHCTMTLLQTTELRSATK